MKYQRSIRFLAVLLFALPASLALHTEAAVEGAKPMPLSEGWTNDFEAARMQAAEDGKYLLLNFTGSDWCGPCIILKKTILRKESFKEGVKDHFILVELDYPRDKSLLSDETVAQNRALAKLYSIGSFPTVLLTDTAGRPFTRMTGVGMEPAEYARLTKDRIATLIMRDQALAKAEELEGPGKARALFNAIEAMKLADEHVTSFYGDVVDQIKAADPDDETGATKTLEMRKNMSELLKELTVLGRSAKPDEALARLDQALSSGHFEGEMKQRVGYEKTRLLSMMKRYDQAIEAAEEAVSIAPDGKWVHPLNSLIAGIEKLKDTK